MSKSYMEHVFMIVKKCKLLKSAQENTFRKHVQKHAKKHEKKCLTLKFLLHTIEDVPRMSAKQTESTMNFQKSDLVKKYKDLKNKSLDKRN